MNVVVGKSRIGKGLFVAKDIKKNGVLFSVVGTIRREEYSPGKSYLSLGQRWLAIGKETWLIPIRTSPWWYLNHSCKPNVGLKGTRTVIAMRKIKKGEQVTIDYSITEDDPYWKMKCACGQRECRKVIQSIRFLPKRLFRKYKGYIPKWLQRK